MEQPRLNAVESACVKRLAELFEQGNTWLGAHDCLHEPACSLDVPDEKLETVLETMEHLGAITGVSDSSEGRFFHFQISARAVQIARAIQEQETKQTEARDIVAELKTTAKSNRALAWIIIMFGVLAAIVVFVNQLLELLKKFGIFRS